MTETEMHCSEKTADALIALGWVHPSSSTDVTIFVHGGNEFVEFWEDGGVFIGEFSGQDHWQPININGGAWRDAWRVIVPEMMS